MMLSMIDSVATSPLPRVRIGPVIDRSIVSVPTCPFDPEAARNQVAAVGGHGEERRRRRGGRDERPGGAAVPGSSVQQVIVTQSNSPESTRSAPLKKSPSSTRQLPAAP